MDARENWLRAIEFRHPEWIPCNVYFLARAWKAHRQELEKVVLAHPRLFPDYQEGSANFYETMPDYLREGEHFTDNFRCVWLVLKEGMEGQVVGHPLADWGALEHYQMPDPLVLSDRGSRDWARAAESVAEARRKGRLAMGSGESLFDRLYFIRGFENLMLDFAEEPPQLYRLIEMLEEYELKLTRRWLELGVDAMYYHTDIGTQQGLMISPAKFRKLLKPMFTRLFQTCRQAGVHVYLSSDGRLLEIVDDLIECGVSTHDPQLRANTVEGIARAYKGKLCANIDLDRQGFPFMSPQELHAMIREVVDKIGSAEGGLMLTAEITGSDIPLRNIAAICEAMELNCFPS